MGINQIKAFLKEGNIKLVNILYLILLSILLFSFFLYIHNLNQIKNTQLNCDYYMMVLKHIGVEDVPEMEMDF